MQGFGGVRGIRAKLSVNTQTISCLLWQVAPLSPLENNHIENLKNKSHVVNHEMFRLCLNMTNQIFGGAISIAHHYENRAPKVRLKSHFHFDVIASLQRRCGNPQTKNPNNIRLP